VVLRLVSTKNATIELAAELSRGVDEASRYHPRELMALSTHCGFALVAGSSGIGTSLQEAKLRLVADVAHQLWR
jgi:5-methyltetrahydropteroyltriglutamate--homocysteine methyltransferase